MKIENNKQSRILVVILFVAAGATLLLLALSIRSLAGLVREPRQEKIERIEPVASASVVEVPNAGHAASGHEAPPQPEQSSLPASPAPVAAKKTEFIVDYRTICVREDGRKAMIETLRQQAKENPESGSALSEERIQKLEQSGNFPQ